MAISSPSSDKARVDIMGLAKANRIRYRIHALLRMAQRGVKHRDVHRALCLASRCIHQPKTDRWKVDGPDFDGAELTLLVEIDDGLLIVTVF